MAGLIASAMEDHYTGLTENEGTHDLNEFQRDAELTELREEAAAIDTGARIERVIRHKIDRGDDLTDEEIFIAAETISSLYTKLGSGSFSGFGFESFEGKDLTQKERSKIALEAITNQNAEKFSSWKAKFERFGAGLSDYASWFSGNQEKLKTEAQELLAKVRSSSESDFTTGAVTDKRVSIAINRGYKQKPFSSYKEVLAATKSLSDSAAILASATKYESLGGKDGGKWDLAKLAEDMDGKIIDKKAGKVTYDLNPNRLNGYPITITVPDNSQSNYVMRNLKTNFVVSAGMDDFNSSLDGGYGETNVRPLTKKEAEELCKAVIEFIEKENNNFRKYYSESKVGFTDILKIIGKSIVAGPLGLLVYVNSLVYRGRIQNLNTRLHYINRGVIRGLLAWVASSMK